MEIFVSFLIILTSVLLILIVLVQNSKGGGLASNFAGSNQFLGVRKTADFLEKSTWTLAIVLLVLSLFSIFVIPRNATVKVSDESTVLKTQQEKAKQAVDFQPAPGKEATETPVQK